jgi:hypothetical protein
MSEAGAMGEGTDVAIDAAMSAAGATCDGGARQ